jgi:Ca2+-binding RTX toxin-like protein
MTQGGNVRVAPVVALAVTILTLAATATAHADAAQVSLTSSNGQLFFDYTAAPGQANNLVVHNYDSGECPSACFTVSDTYGISIDSDGMCTTYFEGDFSNDPHEPDQQSVFCEYGASTGLADDSTTTFHIQLGDGDDTVQLITAGKLASITGGVGNDTLNPGGAKDLLLGGDGGDDVLQAINNHDNLSGGLGNDTLIEPPSGRAYMFGGGGLDTVSFAAQFAGQTIDLRHDSTLKTLESVIGTAGNDTIYGAPRRGELDGKDGNDVIHAGNGYHVVTGGNGDDTLYGGTGNPALAGDPGKDTIYGGPSNDYITDSSGAGTYYGKGGNDSIIAGGKMYGGDGNDKLQCAGPDSCTISDGPGNDQVKGTNTSTTSTGLFGGGDVFIAGPGRDTYDGAGAASGGNVIYYSCAANFGCIPDGYLAPDTISYKSSTKAIRVSLDHKANDGAPGEHDNVQNVGRIVGGAGNDVLTGNDSAPKTLDGGPGNDRVVGGTGSDILDGGPGDDTIKGGGGRDIL